VSPDESDFKDYSTVEEYGKTLEGNKYYHYLYLKAVNNPIRREILKIINQEKKISRDDLLTRLKQKDILQDEGIFIYNLDYLIKALCIKQEQLGEKTFYEITLSGQVVDYLK